MRGGSAREHIGDLEVAVVVKQLKDVVEGAIEFSGCGGGGVEVDEVAQWLIAERGFELGGCYGTGEPLFVFR